MPTKTIDLTDLDVEAQDAAVSAGTEELTSRFPDDQVIVRPYLTYEFTFCLTEGEEMTQEDVDVLELVFGLALKDGLTEACHMIADQIDMSIPPRAAMRYGTVVLVEDSADGGEEDEGVS